MPPQLPASLSPHIVVLPTPDLVDLLSNHGLPPIHHLLESLTPVSQVTTRTTALASITHAHFPLRFSDLSEIEAACREDEESRASRVIDWIGARIGAKAAAWVDDLEKRNKGEPMKGETKWWEELRRCVDGDRTPSRGEGWSHPVALILATTTLSANPLQAITHLHSRIVDLPTWVDSSMLRYTIIVHPTQLSNLSLDETTALFNATKKQYGLHTHLLPLNLRPAANLKPLPSFPPQLPSLATFPTSPGMGARPLGETVSGGVQLDILRLSEEDIASTARFIRELVTMSLVPWMERCVLEWNENYTSTRRLPSRLFTTTRRLFGSSSTSSTPTSSSINSPTAPSTPNNGSPLNVLPQQRRLAEFATMLGDYKLAIMLWESIRKEGKGGSDVLPMLLAPSLTLEAHAAYALSPLRSGESITASAQLKALKYAIRWEQGVQDFMSLGGERWLVWAAGATEEPSMALLLAQGALLSLRKGSRRTAAMWYVFAANRLEKCGVKPLTVYFLRKAYELFTLPPEKLLSPSFDEITGKLAPSIQFDSILPSIEHALGRLKYTTGDAEGAVQYFLGLLKGSVRVDGVPEGGDKVYLDDFRVALDHLKGTSDGQIDLSDIKLPTPLCQPSLTRMRFSKQTKKASSDLAGSGALVWEENQVLEDRWKAFWKARGGTASLKKQGQGIVGEPFILDVVLKNPLDVPVSIGEVSLVIKDRDPNGLLEGVQASNLKEIVLGPKELKSVPFEIVATNPVSLEITHVTFNFLHLLPTAETLAVRGKRLNDTALQRQEVVYAPDVVPRIAFEQSTGRLQVETEGLGDENEEPLALIAGELREFKIRFRNVGSRGIGDIWMVCDESEGCGFITLGDTNGSKPFASIRQVSSSNSLHPPEPVHIWVQAHHGEPLLQPGQAMNLPVILHASAYGPMSLSVLFVFREDETATDFHTAVLERSVELIPILEISTSVSSGLSGEEPSFVLTVEAENVGELGQVRISQLTSISSCWKAEAFKPGLAVIPQAPIPENQVATLFVHHAFQRGVLKEAMRPMDFLRVKMASVLQGNPVEQESPPKTELFLSHLAEAMELPKLNSKAFQDFLHASIRQYLVLSLAAQFPHIPASDCPSLFPLYTPWTASIALFWDIPSTQRSGCLLVHGIMLGAGHGALNSVIEQAQSQGTKVRSMYAETARERSAILEALKSSSWNKEDDPALVSVSLPAVVEHDFSSGPLQLDATFAIRNTSITLPFDFTLSMNSSIQGVEGQRSPHYIGSRVHRGRVEPLSSCFVTAKLWVIQPGIYMAHGWQLQTTVVEEGGRVIEFRQSGEGKGGTFVVKNSANVAG